MGMIRSREVIRTFSGVGKHGKFSVEVWSQGVWIGVSEHNDLDTALSVAEISALTEKKKYRVVKWKWARDE